MISSRSKTIWDRSAPLSHFVTDAISNDIQNTPSIATSLRWQLAEYLFKIADGFFGRDQVPERIRNAIVCGELIATGVRMLPSKSPGPVEIPPDQFVQGRFHILSNVVTCDEFSYCNVRIVAKASLPVPLLSARPNQQTRQFKIRNVIQGLANTGQLHGILRKQQIPIVRAALIGAGVENIGSDKTIERLIRINCAPIK